MEIVTGVINVIFAILLIIALIWNMAGGLPGIIFLILALITKDKEKKKKYFQWTMICFGGIALMLAIIILFAIYSFLGALFGFPISTPIPM